MNIDEQKLYKNMYEEAIKDLNYNSDDFITK